MQNTLQSFLRGVFLGMHLKDGEGSYKVSGYFVGMEKTCAFSIK